MSINFSDMKRENHTLSNLSGLTKHSSSGNCTSELKVLQINALTSDLFEFITRIFMERSFFQNNQIPQGMLLHLANDVIKTLSPSKNDTFSLAKDVSLLWKQIRRQPLTKDEENYLESPVQLDVMGEILQGIRLSSMALLGQSFYQSLTSCIKNRLYTHLPNLCGYFGLIIGGPQAISYVVSKSLDKFDLTGEQRSLLKPWLNAVGRLSLGLSPKVHGNEEGIHYHYPSTNGYTQTFSTEQTVTVNGNRFTVNKPGHLETDDQKFAGTYEAEFRLGKVYDLTHERVRIKVLNKEGREVPIEFIRTRGKYGPEITVRCDDQKLRKEWDSYFNFYSNIKSQQDPNVSLSCKTGVALGALGAMVFKQPLMMGLGVGACIPKVSANKETIQVHSGFFNEARENTYGLTVYRDVIKENKLISAATEGDKKSVEKLLDSVDLESSDEYGLTALHWAIGMGHIEVVELLLESGASIQSRYKFFDPKIFESRQVDAFDLAIMHGDLAIIKAILKEKSSEFVWIDHPDKMGSYLHLALYYEKFDVLEYFLSSHSKDVQGLLNVTDMDGRTAFHLAASLGYTTGITILSKFKIDLEQQSKNGRTAVHYAALKKRPAVIQKLHQLGANLDARDNKGLTPVALIRDINDSDARECKALLLNLQTRKDKEKAKRPNYAKYPPENLVIQGGGPKGLAYIGAIQKLEERKALRNLRRVAGTSAGAITAAFIAVGCDANELKQRLENGIAGLIDPRGEVERSVMEALQSEKDFISLAVNFIKSLFFGNSQQQMWIGWARQTLKRFLSEEYEGLSPVQRARDYEEIVRSSYALADGEKLRDWLEEIILDKTGIKNCTFGELGKLASKEPDKFKELHVFAVKLQGGSFFDTQNLSKIERFSSDEEKWANLIVSDALRASASIPGIFGPHILHFKNSIGKRIPDRSYGEFADVGLIRNYPLDAFDDHKYHAKKEGIGEQTNRKTLGLSIREPQKKYTEDSEKLASTIDLFRAYVNIYYNVEQMLLNEKSSHNDRSIIIPSCDVGLTDFNLSGDKKECLIEAGSVATTAFFQSLEKAPVFEDKKISETNAIA